MARRGAAPAGRDAAATTRGAATAIGGAVGGIGSAAGRAVEDGLDLLGDAVGGIPVLGRALTGILDLAGDVAAAAGETWGAAVRGGTGIAGAWIAGGIEVVGAIAGGRPAPLGRAACGVAAAVGGAVIVTGGLAVGTLQEAVPGLQRSRRLTAAERETLREVFDDAVPLDDVRVVPERGRSGVFGVNRRAFTLGNTVYLKGDRRASLLVHECVHVWQYHRRGPRYAADAVHAQNVGAGYDWAREAVGPAARWSDLNVEGQAEFVQDLYDGGTGAEWDAPLMIGQGAYARAYDRDRSRDFVHRGISYRALAEDALTTIRGRRTDPPPNFAL